MYSIQLQNAVYRTLGLTRCPRLLLNTLLGLVKPGEEAIVHISDRELIDLLKDQRGYGKGATFQSLRTALVRYRRSLLAQLKFPLVSVKIGGPGLDENGLATFISTTYDLRHLSTLLFRVASQEGRAFASIRAATEVTLEAMVLANNWSPVETKPRRVHRAPRSFRFYIEKAVETLKVPEELRAELQVVVEEAAETFIQTHREPAVYGPFAE